MSIRHHLNKTAYCLLALTALAFAAACGGKGGTRTERRQLAVGIEPVRALLEPLARGRFDVVCVMDRSTDPENFEPSVSRRMAADASAAFFMTGALPFETTLAEALPDSVSRVRLLDAVEPVYGTHDDCGHAHHTHDGAMPDPHIWTSARNARRMVAAMAAELQRLDPAAAAIYASRRDSLTARLDSLDASVAATLADAPARTFVVWHPALSYAARDYGLQQVALGAEGKDFSAPAMRRAIERARTAGARVMFVQRGSDTGRTRSVCDAAGLRPVEVDLLSPDLETELKTIARELARP
ncbi:MAG: zinc ABC transporter substrate-binding protein [Muribaculaceae bacterium]|nr:zinc ABC transporter substrate-binding protein [Muribaculaceae bacterium]